MATVDQLKSQNALADPASLDSSLGNVRNRILSIGILSGIGWSLLILILALLFAVWLDLLWELSAWARINSVRIAALAGAVVFAFTCWLACRRTNKYSMARRMDSTGRTGGKIISGLQLSETKAHQQSPISDALRLIAVEQASVVADEIDNRVVVPGKPIANVAALIAIVSVVAGVIGLALPHLASTQWRRFASPTNDAPPFSTIRFDVQPGNVEVIYGGDLEISAKLNESTVDDVELVMIGPDLSQQTVPMFSRTENHWRSILTRIDAEADYFVRSGRARSEKYSIKLIMVPEIRKAEVRISPPEYTQIGRTIGPIPESGIDGLRGTKVEVFLESNRPLSEGQMVISYKGSEQTIMLDPTGEQDNRVSGAFEIVASGKFEIRVTDVSGLKSRQLVSGSIGLLKDHRPFVRLLEPKPLSLATADARLPVAIDAEDDYGISSLQLFRSLNDSRPISTALDVQGNSARVSERIYLPLEKYQLEPGDQIKLFARVEDNDPAGVKGSESPVHVVQIISQEQFRAMQQQQLGIEAILAKYRQIQRQLEQLDNVVRELEENAAGDQDAQQLAEQMKNAADRFREEANEMRKLAGNQFPVDFDKELADRIKQMADDLDDVAQEIQKMAEQLKNGEITEGEFQKRLAELKAQMGMERKEFGDEVMQPLDGLAKAFPLMMLESDFVELVMRQRNLAERLRSFDGKENVDDPALKRRMRELAEEQRQLYDRLDDILAEIESKAMELPLTEEFDPLRQSALAFVQAVEDSQAFFEMEDAEYGLEDFSGTRGFQHADRAATILESFLNQGEAMGQAAEGACKQCFNPSIGGPNLGNSIAQLMQMFGKGTGRGLGSAGNGYSQRRSTAQNMGLYGTRPVASAPSAGRGQGDRQGVPSAFGGSRESGKGDAAEISTSDRTGGSSDVGVPIQYKTRVGEYFRRIVEETGEQR